MQFSEYRIKEKSLVVGQVVLGLLILWSLLYNILIKKQHLFEAFFGIIDTLTEDLFMRAGYGLFTAICIIIIAFLSQSYTQMLANNSFFRQMEIIFTSEMEENNLALPKDNGILEIEDIKKNTARDREPIQGTYRGWKIISMAPPSSGGVVLIQILSVLEKYDLSSIPHNSAELLHLYAETMADSIRTLRGNAKDMTATLVTKTSFIKISVAFKRTSNAIGSLKINRNKT